MLSRGTVCVHDVTHLTGNWVTMFVREKLPLLSAPSCSPQLTHSEKDRPFPECGRCQRWDNQSVGPGVMTARVPCCDNAETQWE